MPNERKALNDFLTDQNILATDDTPIDVVYGGAFSIKDYYMESGNPTQMRGASQLLLEAADAFEKQRYFACGAESFLIVPQGKGENYARKMEQTFCKKTRTAQAAAVSLSTTVGVLRDEAEFAKLWEGLNKAFAVRRMLLLPPIAKPMSNKPCKRCNFRDAAKGDECASCANRTKTGREARNTYKQECLDIAKGDYQSLALTIKEDAKSIQDLADGNGDFALLYGDINDLGWAGKQLGGNVEKRRDFTDVVKKTVKSALYIAVLKAMRYSQTKAFEIIAVGGDDICVLLPGEVALAAGTLLLQEFDAGWAKTGFGKLTMSAGIAVGQANTPVLYMRETAEQLLLIAKEKAYNLDCSCLDILSLNSDAQWTTRIKRQRKDERAQNEGAGLTMRPFTVNEAGDLLKRLHTYKINNSTLHSIAEAALRCGVAEGDLWFNYLLSRQPKGEQALEKLAGEYNCAMYYDVNGKKTSPWRDFTELRGQKGGEEV